ncbi:hypothetical protein LY90DRAFT_272340 [Neocallimastix californiae]|uniref:Uncharacterized protein n=1 Tax=Neocallimastix californiae TaxID=1754190 RepID=A0A1Y1Y2V3_9FUNG|nr:hypothetical protein LY90DRAFT_272340 [Neocallimastix californiae]|eukprot:ORX92330.1 hypothetical protein LY90DRAFT_272340 [Neocallimastix californiae]
MITIKIITIIGMIVLDYLMLFFEHIKIYDNEFIKQLLFIIEIKKIFLYQILINIFQMRNIKY